MELQPVLDGPRLKLRPLKARDFEKLYEAASDPLIWEQHPSSDRWRRPVFEEFFERALESKGALAVERKSDGALIGTSRYYDLDGKRSVVIGFTFLTREHWGGDWNRELKFLMLDHAFIYVSRVLFHVGEMNLRSRKAMEKIGAKLIGRLEGAPKPTVVYEIRR